MNKNALASTLAVLAVSMLVNAVVSVILDVRPSMLVVGVSMIAFLVYKQFEAEDDATGS